MRLGTWLLIATVLTIGTVVACQGVERGEVGSRESPIIWFLPPGTDVRIQHTASLIAERIGELCSYYIVVQAATDSCALIAAFVGAPGDVMGLVDADSYLEIASRTNVAENVVVVGVIRGFVATPIGVYALRNRNIASRKDLMGKVWVYPSTTSKEYRISKLVFDREKLTFAGSLEAGSAVECLKALLDGRGDFCTAWWFPPIPNLAGLADFLWGLGWRYWEWGYDPEFGLWDRWANEPCAGWFCGVCQDLRAELARKMDAYGDVGEIVKKVGVVELLGWIPNDAIVFCQGFPKKIQTAIATAMEYQSIANLLTGPNWYGWSGVMKVDDSFYDEYRELKGITVPGR